MNKKVFYNGRWISRQRVSQLKNPIKHKARVEAHNRLFDFGKICEGCGSCRKLERHHYDYSKPLEVTWLCKKCHVKYRKRPLPLPKLLLDRHGTISYKRLF